MSSIAEHEWPVICFTEIMGFTTPPRLKVSRRRRALAFTLPEVVIAGSILAIAILGALSVMTQINRWACAARLRTLALALAQQKIDEILTTPWSVNDSSNGTTPAALTVVSPSTPQETNLPLDNDNFNNATGLSSVFSSLDTPISGSRMTTIKSVGTRMVSATVIVSYKYRGRDYTETMTTLRTTDDF
jgi:Tfp pilus assembly protein PilV